MSKTLKKFLYLGISALLLVSFSGANASAKVTSSGYLVHTSKIKHEKINRSKSYRYLLTGNQTLTNPNMKNLLNPDKSYAYAQNNYVGAKVHIIRIRVVGDYRFAYIYIPRVNKKLWTPLKSLGIKKNQKAISANFNKIAERAGTKYLRGHSKQFDTQMDKQTYRDLNKDRQKAKLTHFVYNPSWNKLTRMRSKQISTNFTHYPDNDPDRKPYIESDAKRLHMKLHGWAENIAQPSYGRFMIYPNFINSRKIFNNKNGVDLANCANDEMMYYDRFKNNTGEIENNGHRDNILDPSLVSVSIDAFHPYKQNLFYLTEDFDNSSDIGHQFIYQYIHRINKIRQKHNLPRLKNNVKISELIDSLIVHNYQTNNFDNSIKSMNIDPNTHTWLISKDKGHLTNHTYDGYKLANNKINKQLKNKSFMNMILNKNVDHIGVSEGYNTKTGKFSLMSIIFKEK